MHAVRSSFSLLLLVLLVAGGCSKSEPDAPSTTEGKVLGCTDEKSYTYNPEAEVEDGTCKFMDKKQKSLIVVFTSTNCEPCGGYGRPLVDTLESVYGDDLVIMELHNRKPIDPFAISNEEIDKWVEIFDARFKGTVVTPTIVQGGLPDVKRSKVNGITPGGFEQLSASISSTLAAEPQADLLLDAQYRDDSIYVSGLVQYFKEATPLHTLAVYLVENKLEAIQDNSNDHIHDHVFRATLTPKTGVPLSSSVQPYETDSFRLQPLKLPEGVNLSNVQLVSVIYTPGAGVSPFVVNAETHQITIK